MRDTAVGVKCAVMTTLCVVVFAAVSAQEPVLNTRTVEMDGVKLRVRTSEIASPLRKLPAVVFESGAAMGLETWDKVLPDIARLTTVVAYDRSGTGQSEWDGLPPTPERINARLKRVLSSLGVAPPFVIVGHSWGGALARSFAAANPAEVAGVLYIDPTDITLTRADMIALFVSIGSNEAGYDEFLRVMEKFLPASGPVRAESIVIMEQLNDGLAPPAPKAPASMILAGRVVPPPQGSLSFDTKAYATAFYQSRVQRLKGWAMHGGTFEIAPKAGHFVHVDEPERVIAAIRALLGMTR